MIIRRKTVIPVPVDLLRQDLSLAALGLAVHILDGPEDEIDTTELALGFPGVDIDSLVSELQDAGFFRAGDDPPPINSPVMESPARPTRKHAVYVVGCAGRIKIGIATNVRARISTMRTGNPVPITLIWSVFTEDALEIEQRAHAILGVYRISGEWFECSRQEAIGAVSTAIVERAGRAA